MQCAWVPKLRLDDIVAANIHGPENETDGSTRCKDDDSSPARVWARFIDVAESELAHVQLLHDVPRQWLATNADNWSWVDSPSEPSQSSSFADSDLRLPYSRL